MRYLLVATVLLAFPASASAQQLTVAESIQIAERWAAQQAPGHINHCSNGRLQLAFDPTPSAPGEPVGLAHGWVTDGNGGWVWDNMRCIVTIRADQTPEQICGYIAHEVLHFVLGPEHVGPLAEGVAPPECYAPTWVLPDTESAKPRYERVAKRRTRAQIARSMRYKRQRAKIRARRAARQGSAASQTRRP